MDDIQTRDQALETYEITQSESLSESDFISIGIDALAQNQQRIERAIQATETRIRQLARFTFSIIREIVLFPRTVIYFTGITAIAILGATATREGHALIRYRTQQVAMRTQRSIQMVYRGLQAVIVRAETKAIERAQAAQAKAQERTQAVNRRIYNYRLRRRVAALTQYHVEQVYEIRSLHERMYLLQTRKRELETLLEQLLDETVRTSSHTPAPRRDYEDLYGRPKV